MKNTPQEHFEIAAALFADTPAEGYKMLMAVAGNAEYEKQRDAFLQTQLKDKNLVKEIVSSLTAESNDPKTDFLIGEAYGFSGRPQHAFDSYIKAAGNGFAPAKFALGRLLIDGKQDHHGEAVIKNPEMAIAWLNEAADQNYAPAQNMLGKLHRAGVQNSEGEVILTADPAKALDWFRKAADQDLTEARTNAESTRYPEVLRLIKTKLLQDPRVTKLFGADAKNHADVQISQALKEVLHPQEGHSAEPTSSWAQKHRKDINPLPELRTSEAHDKPLTELIIKSLEKRSVSKSVSDMVKEGVEDYLRKIKPSRNADISAVGALAAPVATGFAQRIKAASTPRSLSPIAGEGEFAEQVRSASPERAPTPVKIPSPSNSVVSDWENVSEATASPKSAASRTPSPTNSDASSASGEWQMVVSRSATSSKGNSR